MPNPNEPTRPGEPPRPPPFEPPRPQPRPPPIEVPQRPPIEVPETPPIEVPETPPRGRRASRRRARMVRSFATHEALGARELQCVESRLSDDRRRPLDRHRPPVKRVGSAVGEGAMAIQPVHRYLVTRGK